MLGLVLGPAVIALVGRLQQWRQALLLGHGAEGCSGVWEQLLKLWQQAGQLLKPCLLPRPCFLARFLLCHFMAHAGDPRRVVP